MNNVVFLMKKIGMSTVFKESRRVPITLLQLEDCVFFSSKKEDASDMVAVTLMFGKIKTPNKAQLVEAQKLGFDYVGHKRTFFVAEDEVESIKNKLSVSAFTEGQRVDIRGLSVGKGFAGVMKRYNFPGMRASHGVSATHRSGGSTGQCQDPGKVFKGKKMAGRMGYKNVTIQNLHVMNIDVEKKLLIVKGAVPGANNSRVELKMAVKG